MAAESDGESERDPLEAFIDEVFEEMVRDAGVTHAGAGVRHGGKDPLAGALMEAAVAYMANPPSRSTELERVLFAQSLATALADSLAPALAEVLSSEIMKVLTHHADSHSGGTHESVGGGAGGHRAAGGGGHGRS
ncbi:hypothetical protein ACFW1F_17880 [Streptomyces bungoensis]|uniref:hypothetical protein n=1 Tax=Streptomyces bungoensis TaxID=285568 RepID=UPI00341213F7